MTKATSGPGATLKYAAAIAKPTIVAM